jgi:putative membrane-bound dehydrogenase-like protein
LNEKLKPIDGKLQCKFQRLDLAFDTLPTRAQWEDHAAHRKGALGYQAKKVLAAMDRGEAPPDHISYPVQTWTFGNDLAMVFLTGEVVVDYSLRLKKEFDVSKLWVTAYANDVPCYIPSRRVWAEGGYEGGGAMAYYNLPTRLAAQTEDRIIAAVHAQLPETFLSEDWRAEFPPPKSPAESLACIKTKSDLTVELVASEPLVVDPIDIHFAPDGKLWVVEMNDYPSGCDNCGRIKYLEDTDGDGKYDKATIFLDGLHFPTGVMTWSKGVFICVAPDLIYAEKISDGIMLSPLYSGFSTKSPQYQLNSLTFGLDNWIYGASQQTNAKIRKYNGKSIALGHRDFRMNPYTSEFEPATGASQYGRTTDDWGNWFGCDNSNLLWHFPLPEYYIRRNPHVASLKSRVDVPADADPNRLFPISRTLSRFNDFDKVNRVTSACSPAIYRDELLGPGYTDNAFICEPVHNLVHRLIVEPRGVTFVGHRPADEQNSEFLASTDNWFRPVQVRTGPDGALWIVDMYRFVIEHPQWIPEERLAQLDVRAGSDKGRIYRVYPKGEPPRSIRNLTKLTTAELVAAMDSPNGPEHDLIRRELLQRADPVSFGTLDELVKNSSRPAVRVQALSALDGLHALIAPLLTRALADPHPGVRRQAIRLCEPEIRNSSSNICEALVKLVDDPDPGVCFQLALSLGDWNDPRVGEALGRLALTGLDDPWQRAAVLSSAVHSPGVILGTLLSEAKDSPARTEMIGQLIGIAAAAGDRSQLEKVLIAISPQTGDTVAIWHLVALKSLLDAMSRKNLSLASFESADPAVKNAAARLNQMFADARLPARDEATDESLRVAAIALLGRSAAHQEEDLQLLIELMQPQQPIKIQTAAIAALAETRSPRIPALLLNTWKTATPSLREIILDTLFTRREWLESLLSAIESQSVPPLEIDVTHREKLLKHADAGIQKRAAGLLAAVRPISRTAAIEKFRGALALKGDAVKGAEIFSKTCSTCHAFRGQGHAVGPDLAALNDKSAQFLLTSILDPNAAVEAKFTNYVVETNDSRLLTGIIVDDTSTSLTLLQSNAIRETLLRKDIAEIRSSGISLMPEGLEEGRTPQEFADLLAYLLSK